MDDLSSFWEVQHFNLVSGVPGGSIHIVDYTPFDGALGVGDTVSVTVEYEATGPFEFEATIAYEAKTSTGTWWCEDRFPLSPGIGTLVLECSLGPMPPGVPAEFPYPHDQGIIEALLTYRASPTRYELVTGEFVVDDLVCPSADDWPFPDCPPATPRALRPTATPTLLPVVPVYPLPTRTPVPAPW